MLSSYSIISSSFSSFYFKECYYFIYNKNINIFLKLNFAFRGDPANAIYSLSSVFYGKNANKDGNL